MLKTRPRKPTIASRTAKLPRARPSAARALGCQVCLGSLIGWDQRGPLVDFAGNPHGPILARLAGTLPRARLAAPATMPAREVVLLVDPRPRRPPVLLGFLQPLGAELDAASQLEARVDGRRVEIEGQDEIVLRCGAASITLRRNGRVVIRGTEVETRARGLNRIKGGSVAIN
jgi:hypothetical protein